MTREETREFVESKLRQKMRVFPSVLAVKPPAVSSGKKQDGKSAEPKAAKARAA